MQCHPPLPTSSPDLNMSWEREQFTTLHGLRVGMDKFGKLIITHSCQSSKKKKKQPPTKQNKELKTSKDFVSIILCYIKQIVSKWAIMFPLL